MDDTRLMYDVAIVGVGAYGTAVLGQISLNKIPKEQRRFRILVVERREELGPGMPYSKRSTIPDHIVNIAGGCTQITATYIPVSEKSDFLLWLRSLTPERRVSMGVEEHESANWLHHPFPRFIVGLYLSDRFNQFVQKLRMSGFTVDVHNLTPVNSVARTDKQHSRGQRGYELHLEGKGKVVAKTLFIATGHWIHNRFPEFAHWIPSPFPPQTIQQKIKLGSNTGILGCSLSAIDTALTLSNMNGEFHSGQRNGLIFRPFQGAESFKITMYGRKAILPQVMGVVVNKIFAHKYLTAASFIPVIKANNGFLPLNDFWYFLKKEIYDEVPHIRRHLPDDWQTLTLEEAVFKMRKYLQATDAAKRLEQEIKEAKRSLITGIPLLLQNVFYQSYAIFDEALNYFSAEDRIRFEEIKTELHLLIAPFPMQNAEKIHALILGGFLEIKKIGNNYTIDEAAHNKGIKLTWRPVEDSTAEAYHEFMVDATGQQAAFEKDSSPLTASLRNEKLIKEVLVPFRNSQQSKKYEDHPMVVTRSGSCFFRPPGALIDINNFSLVSRAQYFDSPIYYMGPLTMGQVAFPQDLSVVTTAAERAVADLVKRGVLERDSSCVEDQDPMPMYGWLPNAKGDLTGQMEKMTNTLSAMF